jgi:hypothetical protein
MWNDLKLRLDRFNNERKNVFGTFETCLTGSERIVTITTVSHGI